MNVNKVILVGRLGKDPVISHPQQDITKADFTMATTESYKKDDQWHDITEWHNISAWRSTAMYVERHLKKGMLVYVEGKIRSGKYTDKNGVVRYTFEIVADTIQKLERNERISPDYSGIQTQEGSSQPVGSNENMPDTQFNVPQSADDDLPF